jgi:DUF1680 family protein
MDIVAHPRFVVNVFPQIGFPTCPKVRKRDIIKKKSQEVFMIERVDYSKVCITGGFWRQKQDMVRDVTVHAVYNRFKDTGRIDAFRCEKEPAVQPHIFWDSDVAKWIEGVAYLLEKKEAPELEKIVDGLIADIEKNQEECGYFNSYYLVLDYDERFTKRDCHELYCAGHFIEAAVAYYEATGKRSLLDIMIKYVDYIEKRFKIC